MPRLAANLSTLFTELPFLERFGAAAAAGFNRVEYQFPYGLAAAAAIGARAQAAGVQVVLHNLPIGDEARGDRGIAGLPGRSDEFRRGVALAIKYAQAAGCQQLNCLAGLRVVGSTREQQLATLIENLRDAADQLQTAGMTLLIEPLNPVTMPGFLLPTSSQAMTVIKAVQRPNLRLQFDLFQMQMAEGNLATTIEGLLPYIGHMQIAGVPG